ncbi:MAG: hypothetical protein KGH61_02375 [Candidatus Micrarchaeota archaeon]|nr:hypothetical protein [Candidatus Micrarchaeota archaeon]MDE1847774.1 hypothetical protein [Candidatus Micrarchaeota archaeon]MDE1864212.1 hypothetical protein [Candidatus Micrarchaeota archaeon]
MSFKVVGGKFNFGVDIDDMWRYAGIPDPPSVIVPFLLRKKTHNGRFSLPATDPKLRKYEVGDFVGSLLKEENGHEPRRLSRAVASFLKKNGIDYVRCWFPWNFFETSEEGVYEFPLDDFVKEFDEAGIGIMAVIGDGYNRFVPENIKTSNVEAYAKRLVRASREIVRHYKGRVRAWQIENEPNGWIGQGLADWRTGLIWLDRNNQKVILGALSHMVREEYRRAKLVINIDYIGLKVDWKWYSQYCDIIGVDSYPSYVNPRNTDMPKIAEIATRAGMETGFPVYMIETGYPTGPKCIGFNEARQAEYVASACKRAASCDSISGMGIYRLADSYWKSFPPQEDYFGLLDVQGRAKPAWNEYIRQIRKAKGHY